MSSGGRVIRTEPNRIERIFANKSGRTASRMFDLVSSSQDFDPVAARVMLHMGYVPGTSTLFRNVTCLPGGRDVYIDAALERGWEVESIETVPHEAVPAREAAQRRELDLRFTHAVHQAWQADDEVIIPLSGGLDSRLLLAGALRCTEARNITTYTYGVPGGLDFELGSRVARLAGTRHHVMDMSSMPWTLPRLLETARITDANNNLFHPYVWTEVRKRFGANRTIWSGYTGDGLGGSFFCPDRGETANDAVHALVRTEAQNQPWTRVDDAHAESAALVEAKTKYGSVLHEVEAVWFENHPERFTTHHIFVHGLKFATPFMAPPIVRFLLNLPDDARRGKGFFNRWAARYAPELFEVPTKSYGYTLSPRRRRHMQQLFAHGRNTLRKLLYRGFPRAFVHPSLTYVDFNVALREPGPFRQLVARLIDQLAARDVLDAKPIRTLWNEQQRGARHGPSLQIFASIELALMVADGA